MSHSRESTGTGAVPTSKFRHWPALLLLAALAPACGEGGGVVVVNLASSVTITTPGASSGNVTITYSLIDPESDTCTILVEFSLDGGTSFATATAGPGGNGISGLTSSPTTGTSHTFVWNSLVDVGAANNATIRIRITPSDAQLGTAGTTTNFAVNNATNTRPSATITTPGASSGLVTINYSLIDTESNTCSISVTFSADGGATNNPATMGPGGDGLTNLTSSPPTGTAHTYTWNSLADGVATGASNANVQIRITPNDGQAAIAPTATGLFAVDNTTNSSGGALGSAIEETTVSAFVSSAATDGTSSFIVGQTGFAANNDQWRIEKRTLATGALDASFNGTGFRTVNPGTGGDLPLKLVIDGTAMYILAIKETGPSSGIGNWYLEKRLLSDGTLDATFNSGAGLTLAGNDGAPGALLVDGTSIYLAIGEKVGSNYQWRIEKRNKLTGALDTAFGSLGVIVEDINGNPDAPAAIVTDGTYMWLGGVYDASAGGSPPPYSKARFEKRRLDNGNLVAAFGTGGVITEVLNATDELEVKDIVRDGTSLYALIEVKPAVGNSLWRLEKRNLSDGALTVTVADSGASSQGSPGNGNPGNGLFIDGLNLYVGGTDSAGGGTWRLEKRLLLTLALDGTFGTAGVVSDLPAGGSGNQTTFVITGGVIYSGGLSSAGGDHWRLTARWK
jgi:hypothetical protein